VASLNYSAMVIGLPGDGKTSLQVKLAKRHLETTKGIVLAHDPMRQFPRKVGSSHFAYYADVGAFKRAASESARTKKPIPRGASIGGLKSDDVTRLALDMGDRAGNNDDRTLLPVLLMFDEGALREGSGSTFISDLDEELLVTRRHKGVMPVFNLQEVTMLTARFYQVSTDVYAFQQTTDRCALLEKNLHLEKGTLVRAGLTRLPAHGYMHLRMRVGPVREPL
jgi:hypothetical protein